MPGIPNKFKIIAIFSAFALPAVLLLIAAWTLSSTSPYLKTSGQVLLLIVIALVLVAVSGYLSFLYLSRKFLVPIIQITQVLKGILSHTFKPLPEGTNLGLFYDFYRLLAQLQNSFSQNSRSLDNLNKTIVAANNLFEISIGETIDPVILLNSKLEVKFLNTAAQIFTGIKKTDAVGKKVNQFVRLYDKNNNEISPLIYLPQANQTGNTKVFFGSEIKIISAINIQTYANVSVFRPDLAQLIDVSGVILFHDKTKEKQLEAMKLDFVSMAAHELRTPLTSIKGYISVFINENQNKLTQEQLMFVSRINTSTQQLSGLVENLLSVARVERGALTLHNQIVDWVNNVNTQVQTFLHRAEEKRINLTFIIPDRSISKVDIDLVRMNEVLNNIISNALNYTEPQGKIEIRIDQQRGMVTTYVKDTGKGIPGEALPQLFSKFFRVQGGSAEQASRGNGLGLYLSKAIVDLHHGKIWADSEGLGKGSTFAFSLPAVKDNIDINTLTKIM